VVVLIGGYAVYRYEGHRHSGAADHTHSGRVTTDQKQKKGHKGQNGKNGRAKHGSPLSPNWRGDGKAVTLAFGGDVHFEGAIGARLSANPNTALDSVGRLLSGADLSMTNFESALTNGDCPSPQPKQFVFHSPKTALTAFKAAHVTVVTEANNHGEDCGRAGLEESLAITKEAGYPVLGIGKNAAQAFAPYETTINGQRIAIIAATEVIDTNLISSWTATATQPGLASASIRLIATSAMRSSRACISRTGHRTRRRTSASGMAGSSRGLTTLAIRISGVVCFAHPVASSTGFIEWGSLKTCCMKKASQSS